MGRGIIGCLPFARLLKSVGFPPEPKRMVVEIWRGWTQWNVKARRHANKRFPLRDDSLQNTT